MQKNDLQDLVENSFVQTEVEEKTDSSLGIKVMLKRRQKYLYDYFFPKNMRDYIEEKN